MDVLSLGPLKVRRVVKPMEGIGKAPPPSTVVLAHGFGAGGDDLVGLAGMIDAAPGTTFLFPEAPHRITDLLLSPVFSDARAWWMIDMERLQRAMETGELRDLSKEIPAGLDEARAAFVAMIDAIVSGGTPPERIVLGGFSQGAMLATDVLLRDARPFAGLVVLSGTLLAESEWLPRMPARKGLPVFQSHGEDDPILPYANAERLRDALEGAGATMTFRAFDGGHAIPPSVLRDLGRWLPV